MSVNAVALSISVTLRWLILCYFHKSQLNSTCFFASAYIQLEKEVCPNNVSTNLNTPEIPDPVNEDIDIDLEDPGVAKAAVLLQAGFRGLKARQKFKTKKV